MVLLAALLLGFPPAGAEEAAAGVVDFGNLFGRFFTVPPDSGTPITQEELKGLACLGAGGAIGAVSVVLGGTAAAVAGASGAAGLVAMPALAAAMWAGCAFGSSAAPGLVWLLRYGSEVFF